MTKRYRLSDVIERERKAHPAVEIELSDGSIIPVPVPAMWPDAAFLAMDRGARDAEVARIVLGDENYERYIADGGIARVIMVLLTDTSQGATLGESQASTG